jgi:hypothetical protein
VVRAQATVSTMALIAGNFSFIQAAAPAVVLSNLGGSGTVYVAGGYTGLDYRLVGNSKIKTAEQLKGAIVGCPVSPGRHSLQRSSQFKSWDLTRPRISRSSPSAARRSVWRRCAQGAFKRRY